MELTAVIRGLEALKEPCEVTLRYALFIFPGLIGSLK